MYGLLRVVHKYMWVLSRRLRVEYDVEDLYFKERNVEDLLKARA